MPIRTKTTNEFNVFGAGVFVKRVGDQVLVEVHQSSTPSYNVKLREAWVSLEVLEAVLRDLLPEIIDPVDSVGIMTTAAYDELESLREENKKLRRLKLSSLEQSELNRFRSEDGPIKKELRELRNFKLDREVQDRKNIRGGRGNG